MKIMQENGKIVMDITISQPQKNGDVYKYITKKRLGGSVTENEFLGINAPDILVEISMPELQGSEKQIAWAEDIRMNMIYNFMHEKIEMNGWVSMLDQGKAMGINTYQELFEALMKANFPKLLQETKAKEIIENRYAIRF